MVASALNDFDRLRALRDAIGSRNMQHSAARGAAGLDESGYSKRLDRNELLVVDRDAVLAGWKGYRCNSPECLAIFFSNEPILECRACHSTELAYRVVAGAVTSATCDASCTNATRATCQCSCGGANHGAKWVVGFTFPRNAAARREAYLVAREITNRYYDADFDAMLAEASAIEERLNLALADAVEAVSEKAHEIAQAALAIPAPTILTKAKKPAADQPHDVLVTRVKISEEKPYSPFEDSYSPQWALVKTVEMTGVRGDGVKVWARFREYGDTMPAWRYLDCNGLGHGHSRSDDCWDATFGEGDVIRVLGRVKGEGDGIVFLSRVKLLAALDPFDLASAMLPAFAPIAEDVAS